MINREQVRARNALQAIDTHKDLCGKEGGNVLSGFPALVINNGLMATLAFCKSKKKGGHKAICAAVSEHFKSEEIGLHGGAPTLDGLLAELTSKDSQHLRLCTAEALAYLNYLRRFAGSDED